MTDVVKPEAEPPDAALPLPRDAFEAALVEHLLTGSSHDLSVNKLVVVGEPPGWRYWQQLASTSDERVLIYPTLSDCLHDFSLAKAGHSTVDSDRPMTALVQLGAQDDPGDQVQLAQALGQSVRCFPHRLIVSVTSADIDDTLFFSFGFRRLRLPGQTSHRLYEFRLCEYKQAPDWLNARFWAHPERFDMDPFQDHDDEEGDEEE